jgi:hypothetical protein
MKLEDEGYFLYLGPKIKAGEKIIVSLRKGVFAKSLRVSGIRRPN